MPCQKHKKKIFIWWDKIVKCLRNDVNSVNNYYNQNKKIRECNKKKFKFQSHKFETKFIINYYYYKHAVFS